ncbi:D-alanyl-lipoteichoic acid biosynthesis protein DltD [Vagococcus carniphilus]|uniref:Protein DltD n=1 Tax=Vagococcus carniphilus TaxID=218144 RepID=A0A430AYL8_9ENTE|nr:D-alanyl-lipoteichoic acid biosynthesis protein DltD [Vagococcus carniphilus]QNN72127.1 D-alanyl-lipoteichoic acid biosynthesis protein DltD [Vagococcus carniphilus]RSU13139.1 D-alanyl-lipoteichoic acid biosynthesis protein DltD [Vagococcus carniphilus]
MISKKKLFSAVGPFFAAIIIIGAIIFSPIHWFSGPSAKSIHEAASSMSVNVLKGNDLKNEAMASDKYLPFFGSSELSRVNAYHPSVLAQKYNRSYEPFLLGAPGTQSLTHFFMLNSMGDELNNKKIVFIISPQWFVKEGVGDPMFSLFFSPLQTNDWVMNLGSNDINDQYLAKRLLHFSSVRADTELKAMMKKIKSGEELSPLDKKRAAYNYEILTKEDKLFSKIGITSKSEKIDKKTKELPDVYSFKELDRQAFNDGESSTSNNEFDIANSFYSKRIAPMKGKLENSQVDFDYTKSPEFSDFQLVLNQIAEKNIDAMFVIPPVNKLWSDYTGLSTDMLDLFSKKINYQLKSQGFKHVVDYTDKRSQAYFMEDTIHLGWRGWMQMDRDLQKFLRDKNKPSYNMNSEEFLSKEWQNYTDFD